MSTEEIKKSGEQKMDKCISQLKKELTTIRTGRANPLILDKVLVDYYGAPTKLNQMAQISVQDGTTLVITPFDKTIVKEIEKALIKADLGITPSSDGIVVRLVFPPLTADGAAARALRSCIHSRLALLPPRRARVKQALRGAAPPSINLEGRT